MTKTPLEEFAEAVYSTWLADAVERGDIGNPITETATSRIHRIWGEAIREAPDDIIPWLLGQDAGPVLAVYHEALVYEKITYGENQVVECEGVVVCRLT